MAPAIVMLIDDNSKKEERGAVALSLSSGRLSMYNSSTSAYVLSYILNTY